MSAGQLVVHRSQAGVGLKTGSWCVTPVLPALGGGREGGRLGGRRGGAGQQEPGSPPPGRGRVLGVGQALLPLRVSSVPFLKMKYKIKETEGLEEKRKRIECGRGKREQKGPAHAGEPGSWGQLFPARSAAIWAGAIAAARGGI